MVANISFIKQFEKYESLFTIISRVQKMFNILQAYVLILNIRLFFKLV